MTNIVPLNIQVPAHLAGRIGQPSALGVALAGGIAGESLPRISIKGSRFRIVDQGVETVMPNTELEVVIVGANPQLSKTYYAKEYDANAEPSGPDCSSLNGVSPDLDAPLKQSDLCATCPMNAWGSKKSDKGKDLKACADSKRLAVVPAGQADGTVYLLSVTASALKGLNAYYKQLGQHGIVPEVVKTKISFDTNASFPKLTFSYGGFVEAADQPTIDALLDTAPIKEITGEAVTVGASIPAVAQAPKPQLVQPQVAPPLEVTAPAEEAPAAAVAGFGGTTAPAPEPAPAPAVTATPQQAETKPAPAVAETNVSLANEIGDMLKGPSDD